MIIEVKNVGKAYKHYSSKWKRLLEKLSLNKNADYHSKHWVLRHINFSVEPGESIGIVGVNGAGKSTLLKLLTGTTQPTEGSIHIHGRVAAILELGMGFDPEFSGRQNVLMSGLMMGFSREEMERLMPKIEEFADIGHYIDEPVRVYSSGMQMRLAFAVATSSRPDILIVDEALSVGDSRFQAKCYARIAEYKEQGTTLLLVSHSAGDVVRQCDRAIFLKDGAIEMDGPARDVTNLYMDELFGKSGTVNRDTEEDDSESESSSAQTATGMSIASSKDVYDTRPGYRPEEYRWGQGGARIVDYRIECGGEEFPSTIEANEVVNFEVKVKFDYDFDSVVPGILIKALDGLFLYGTNSFLASDGKEHIAVSRDDVKVFRFSFPLDLNSGDYLLSFGISAGNPHAELTPLDRRYDSVILHVNKPMGFWGIVDLKSTFTTSH
ncbi:Vitamin B12 import ATP-binding protein BtuD [Halomonadaceae bacterium LMG 33818]|uniref:ABC transporter ATP-binding protein n=1 Tax=Cernens ardua TaxID=3402176 RepID=UPI003EDB7B93